MVGHESVDPKPQGKPGLVTGVTSETGVAGARGGTSNRRPAAPIIVDYRTKRLLVEAKGNLVLIPEPSCGYVRT